MALQAEFLSLVLARLAKGRKGGLPIGKPAATRTSAWRTLSQIREHYRPRLTGLLAAGVGDLLGGASSSVVAVAYGLSFASLIFAPPLSPWLASGVVATFLTTAISAAIMASRSSFRFVVAGPDGATSAVTAALVAALLERLIDVGAPDDLLASVMILLALGTMMTGALLCALGFLGVGTAIRFVPFPVMGGFLAATGALMINGGIRVVTNHRLSFSTLDLFLGNLALAKLGAAVTVALTIALLLRRSRSSYIVPGVVLAGIGIVYLVLTLSGTSLVEAEAEGWMFRPPAAVGLALAWDLEDLRLFPWHVIPALSGDLLAMMFVTTITMLLNTNGIEFMVRRDADLQRELKTIGVANLISSALGGYVSCTSLSRTTMNYAAGGRGRLSGFVVAFVAVSILAIGSGFIAYVPKFVLGGLLLYLGASLMHKWLVDSMRHISWLDYASLLVVALIIVQWGFIAGVLVGVVIGCMTFALSASRVNAIKFSFDGSEYQSSLDRGPDQLAILTMHSHEIQGVILHSYLFFGSANRLYCYFKDLIARRRDYRLLMFDFRLVTGIDSSAMHSFTQIKQLAGDIGAKIVLVNLTPGFRRSFAPLISPDDIIVDDLDHALELCEDIVVAAHSPQATEGQDLVEWLTRALGSAEHAYRLTQSCERLEVQQGDLIAAQGEPADCMHFIVRGRVGIVVNVEGGVSSRVRSLGSYTTIGEMGLITGSLRSATIQAEADSVLYVLSRPAFDRISRHNPLLSQALLTYVITVMAERLRFASNLIGVLRR